MPDVGDSLRVNARLLEQPIQRAELRDDDLRLKIPRGFELHRIDLRVLSLSPGRSIHTQGDYADPCEDQCLRQIVGHGLAAAMLKNHASVRWLQSMRRNLDEINAATSGACESA